MLRTEVASAGKSSIEQLRASIAATPGVVAVAPAKLNPAGDVATITVYPHSSPQAYATTQLVERLRDKVDPPLEAHTGLTVYVGGVTAGAVDFATTLGHKLPLFIGVVVLLSALLLLIVFRSLVIPLQAAVMNLLSIGASLGVIVAIFQWGWFGGLFGVQQGPIESFIPVMLFAIVFGLSMDYEVFLVSRMHERWVRTGDDQRAVQEGLALTGRVVTAAAAIMVCVFLSFMLGEDRIIKEFGLSLASAVFLDALVIRCLLLPAVLTIVGARTWQIPAWLSWLPRINIEGGEAPGGAGAHDDEGAAHGSPRPAARGRHRGSGRLSRLRRGAPAALACAALLLLLPIWPSGSAFAAGGRPAGAAGRPPASANPDAGRPSAAVAAAAASPAGSARVSTPRPTALILFLPGATSEQLASVPSLSTGIMSAAQGTYTTTQLALDISQGARVSTSAYSPQHPPTLALRASGAGAIVAGWQAALRRAHGAPQVLEPGLLASQIPGGAGYAGIAGAGSGYLDGIAAAGRGGRIAALSLGSAATLPARIAALTARKQLVVADLPAGAGGLSELRALSAARPAGELEIVVQRAPDAPGNELLWTSVGGLGGGRELTSQSTNERGLVVSIDLATTILRHLGRRVPDAMRGKPIELDGSFDGARLRAFKARLLVIYGRRLPALLCLFGVWALLMLATLALRRRRARRWAARAGGLALLWTPAAVLVPAAFSPGRAVEDALLVLLCFGLGALSDRLLPWPRAPLAPAVVAVVALTADALAGTQLLARALLGPNPELGVRFYGIGNELKSGLAVLVFAAVAAALYPAVRGRRAASTMAVCGIVLAVIEGSARIGAGVGGVILVSAGTAVATVLLLPGRVTRRRGLIVLISPVVGLVVLAALDLTTAHGTGHYTGSVLHAHSAGEIRDIIVRRYTAAYDELKHGAMPFATAFALVVSALAVRNHRRLLAPVDGDPGWLAALAGGLTAGMIGALSEDSGPVLLVVAVGVLGCVLSYLWGRPAENVRPHNPDTTRAARSRARRPSAGPAR